MKILLIVFFILLASAVSAPAQNTNAWLLSRKYNEKIDNDEYKQTTSQLCILRVTNGMNALPNPTLVLRLLITDKPFLYGKIDSVSFNCYTNGDTGTVHVVDLKSRFAATDYAQLIDMQLSNGDTQEILKAVIAHTKFVGIEVVSGDFVGKYGLPLHKNYVMPLAAIKELKRQYIALHLDR